MSSLPSDIKVGDLVEVTHHMTFHQEWFPAKVVKVTACFVDVLRDGWSKSSRFRKSTATEVQDYCGFRSRVRMRNDEPADRTCRHGTRPVDDLCEVCDAE